MRILAIGDTNSLAETRRVLSRSEFEMYRVPAALAAVRMVRQIPFDLMIVVHPLADTDFAGFHREIRTRSSPCRDSQMLVLAQRSRLPEFDAFHRDTRLDALDVDQPQHLLARAASHYLGPIRVAVRYFVRVVLIQRGREEEATSEIQLAETVVDKEGEAKSKQLRAFPLAEPLPQGLWRVRYRHGLIEVFAGERELAVGATGNGALLGPASLRAARSARM